MFCFIILDFDCSANRAGMREARVVQLNRTLLLGIVNERRNATLDVQSHGPLLLECSHIHSADLNQAC